MDKWVYLDLPFAARRKYDREPRRLIDHDADGEQILVRLSDYGLKGWELVACTDNYATFKRRVSEDAEG